MAIASGESRKRQEAPKILVLVDELWGANINIDQGKPNILAMFETFGWELTLVSPLASLKPCPVAVPYPTPSIFGSIAPAGSVSDVSAYDGLVVLPGRTHANLIDDADCLRLIREALEARLAIAAFCRGVRVLAAAGVLKGKTVTGHPDYADEYKAAGARFVGYKDLKGKSDAPPPVVDGLIVTALRSNYYRAETCEAIRIAIGNSRRVRQKPGENASKGGARTAKASNPAFALYADKETLPWGLLGARSLRRFGGNLSQAPVAILTEGGAASVPAELLPLFQREGCLVLDFGLPEMLKNYPLCSKAAAAVRAEVWAMEQGADELVCMDADTIVLREPSEILLEPDFVAGGRPVHHLLIGSRADSPPDSYWKSLMDTVGVGDDSLFAMRTTIDRTDARFYPNAGLLAVVPDAGILSAWKETLLRIIGDESALTEVSTARHKLFLHQAVLACVLAKTAGPSRFMEFSFGYNFPLHLADKCPAELKPGKLDDLYTVRYDDWEYLRRIDSMWNGIAVPPLLKEWLTGSIAEIV